MDSISKTVHYKQNILLAPDKFIHRETTEDPHQYRSEFQRDRDRIINSQVFRRLNGKTQVVLPLSNDHVRNRLTHTIEVAQIAKVVAHQLKLNQILAETIALGHDLGHTPFGHVGERTLSHIMNNCADLVECNNRLSCDAKGFKHNLQSVRVCCELEKLYPQFRGLNLTNFTLWGIRNHSGLSWINCVYYIKNRCYRRRKPAECVNKGELATSFYGIYDNQCKIPGSDNEAWSFEAFVVKIADDIAQRHHDIEDSYITGILSESEIIDEISGKYKDAMIESDEKNLNELKAERKYFLPYVAKFILNLYTRDLIDTTKEKMKEFAKDAKDEVQNQKDFVRLYPKIKKERYENVVSLSKEMKNADKEFKSFIKDAIHNSYAVQVMDGKGSFVIDRLFKAYINNPNQLRDSTIVYIFNILGEEKKHVRELSKKRIGALRNRIIPLLSESDSDKKFYSALLRAISDHIAGMTDDYALGEYSRLYEAKNV